MSTKNSPGSFDCYANAEDDEPLFILLARDNDAPALVEAWATVRELAGETEEKVEEARATATAMVLWREKHRKAWHIVNTDNFGRDYPDESFVARNIKSKEDADIMTNALNSGGSMSSRYYKVVEDGYQLQPGFTA
jgi:hypothetical protein